MLWLLLALGCTGDDSDSDADVVVSDPDEAGPYIAASLPDTARSSWDLDLPVTVWYPTETEVGATVKYGGLVDGTALTNVPAACDVARPVVMFSHGNGGVNYQTWTVMEYLATHGYVVVAPDHVYNTVWDLDDDRWAEIVLRRPDDIRDSFDWLVSASADSGHVLHGCVDPADGYAVMGHSFGGLTTVAVAGATIDVGALGFACQGDQSEGCDTVRAWLDDHPGETVSDRGDPRVWAAVPWAPAWVQVFGDEGLHAIDAPIMVVGGDRDELTTWTGAVRPFYDGMDHGPRALLGLENAGHYSFTDFCFFVPNGDGCGDDYRPVEEVLVTVRTASLAWLMRHHDERDVDAWLPPEEGVFLWESAD